MTRRGFVGGVVAGALGEERAWLALSLGGDVREARWPDAEQPRSVGSLLKPFLALAYLGTHAQAPVVECRGAQMGCWHAQGHGRQDLIAALANSCNVYFLQLVADVDRAALDLTCLSYGLSSPRRGLSSSRLIGLDEGWPQAPLSIGRAFAGLARNASDRHVRAVLDGMARCAQSGTAASAGFPCFAKTGTASCSHLRRGMGDGYAVAIYPLAQPRSLVLLMLHNQSGANAARDLRQLIL